MPLARPGAGAVAGTKPRGRHLHREGTMKMGN
jgi:hypothetical protein